MIPPGTIAWASAAPGFHPPGPHPLLILQSFANGNIAGAFITHSTDLLKVGLPLLRIDVPSAFREQGGPLVDENSVVALIDDRGYKRIAIMNPIRSDVIAIGISRITLSRIVQLPDHEWQPLRHRIRRALGMTSP